MFMCRQTGNLWCKLIQKGREKKDGGGTFEARRQFIRLHLFFFLKKVWLFQINAVSLHY